MKLNKYLNEGVTRVDQKKLSSDSKFAIAELKQDLKDFDHADAVTKSLFNRIDDIINNVYQDGYDKGYDEAKNEYEDEKMNREWHS